MASASCRRPCQLLGMTVHPVLKLMIMGMCFVPLCLHLMPFGALLVSSGCLETRSTRDLGQGRRDLGPPRKFPVDLGAIWDGPGRPCVPQGVHKYVPRDENGSNFEAFWRDFVALCILMILMTASTVSNEIHVFAAGRRSKEGNFSSQGLSFQHALCQGVS